MTVPAQRRGITRLFWRGVIVLVLFSAYVATNESMVDIIAAAAIAIVALFSAGLWCYRPGLSIPIFPVFAATFVGTYALPLISGHPVVMSYPEQTHLQAALYVIGFLVISTAVWYRVASRGVSSTRTDAVLTHRAANTFFLFSLAAGVVFNLAVNGGWLTLSWGVFTMLRSVVLSLSALSIFVLAYRWGARQLSRNVRILFWVLMAALVISGLPRLYLVDALVALALFNVAYSLARQRVLWGVIIVTVVLMAPLQAGKAAMRERYWSGLQSALLQPSEYPGFFADWFREGATARSLFRDPSEERTVPLAERASLLHILLRVIDLSPERVPYLGGETYAIIPELLVPRVFDPNKIAAHEGTYLLNIAYGFQTREDTASTTIGWGLLNESVANFGWIGPLVLACLIGLFYGWIARFSLGAPILSYRGLFSLLVMSQAIQTEYTAGVYVTALAQSIAALLLVRFTLMSRPEKAPVPGPAARPMMTADA